MQDSEQTIRTQRRFSLADLFIMQALACGIFGSMILGGGWGLFVTGYVIVAAGAGVLCVELKRTPARLLGVLFASAIVSAIGVARLFVAEQRTDGFEPAIKRPSISELISDPRFAFNFVLGVLVFATPGALFVLAIAARRVFGRPCSVWCCLVRLGWWMTVIGFLFAIFIGHGFFFTLAVGILQPVCIWLALVTLYKSRGVLADLI